MTKIGRDGTRIVSLSKEQYGAVNHILSDFYQHTKCAAALLADLSGVLLAHYGPMSNSVCSSLAAVVAAQHEALKELSAMIGEKREFANYLLQGEEKNIEICAITEDYVFAVVFDCDIAFEVMSVFVQRVKEKLRAVLGESPQPLGDKSSNGLTQIQAFSKNG